MTERAASDPEAVAVMDGLVEVSFAVIARLTQLAAENDLSLTQLRALAILRDREPKLSELAAYLGLERSSVSGLIDRAVGRGLLRREVSSEDARAARVSLTAAGERLAGRLAEEFGRLIAAMTSKLSAADEKRLSTLLNRLLD